MNGAAQPADRCYDKVLAGLISYARDDWLGMEAVASARRDCFDYRASYAQARPLTIRVVRDLVHAGAVAGDIAAADDNWHFVPWPLSPEQAIEKIVHDLEERDTYPGPGEVGWLTFSG